MKRKEIYSIAVLFILILSCNKESNTECKSTPLFVAPCPTPEKVHEINTLESGPSASLPQAKFRILCSDSTNPSNQIEYGFNKYPTTGKYHMFTFLDTTNLFFPNQIASVKTYGSFQQRSGFSDQTQVFVEKNDTDIIISFCEMGDNTYFFVDTISAYVGNPISDRVRVPL